MHAPTAIASSPQYRCTKPGTVPACTSRRIRSSNSRIDRMRRYASSNCSRFSFTFGLLPQPAALAKADLRPSTLCCSTRTHDLERSRVGRLGAVRIDDEHVLHVARSELRAEVQAI